MQIVHAGLLLMWLTLPAHGARRVDCRARGGTDAG